MKKGIIVLLIAVLVSGFAFAKFSGSAGVRFDANLDDKIFLTSNASSFDFSFTFASDSVEIAGDEDVHVEVAASAKFILDKLKVKANTANGITVQSTDQTDRGIGVVISLDTAKIAGKDWYVSVLGTQSAYDYAKAPILVINDRVKSDAFGNDYVDDDESAASYVAGYTKLPGVTVGFKGFTASVGFDYLDELLLASGSIETPEFAFNDDAVKVQAAAEFNRLAIDDATIKFAANTLGASAKATVAIQDITVGAALDLGLDYLGAEVAGQTEKDTEFNIDARVDFKCDFVDVNVYTYAGKAGLEYGKTYTELPLLPDYDAYQDFYLEAKAAFDLNAFELPLKVTVKAKNITNAATLVYEKAGIQPSVAVEYAKDAIAASVSFGMNTESKDWNVFAYGTYAFEKFTAGAGLKVAKDAADEMNVVSFGAFAESDKLVEKATFGLAYGLDNTNTYKKGGADSVSNAKFSSNYKAEDAGDIIAYCKIAF